MSRLKCVKVVKLISVICEANDWDEPKVVFVEVGNDFAYNGVLYLNIETDCESANEFIAYVTALLSELYESGDSDQNKLHLCAHCLIFCNN